MKKKNPTKGFLTVATKRKQFLMGANNLKESILDYYPEAKITLFTEQHFIDDSECQQYFRDFDQVLPTLSNTNREKMWGMANSPYDLTFYMDADIEIVDKEISNVFDHLEDGKYDMAYVNLTKQGSPFFSEWKWGPNLYDDGWRGIPDHLSHCGGVALYDTRNPLINEFMMDWYNLYLKQRVGIWKPKEFDYIKIGNFRQWDQLTLWWLIYHSPKYKSLKWKFFEDNYRWNYFVSFGIPNQIGGSYNCDKVDPNRDYWKNNTSPVVIHYSNWMDKAGLKGFL